MKADCLEKLFDFLQRLDEANIHYALSRYREDAISVEIAIPGERWEVDFLEDGEVDVERFTSNGEIYDEAMLAELFVKDSDPETDSDGE